MHIGLLIYGSLDTLSGGYLYDRKLVERLRGQGDSVEIISLPWRGYLRHMGDNFSPGLLKRLRRLPLDILIQDELNHPSLFWLNHRLRKQVRYPIVSLVHHLRSSEARPAWQNYFYRWVERLYLSGVDGFIFNSRTTGQVVEKLVSMDGKPTASSVVAYPAGDRLNPRIGLDEIGRRALQPGPLRLVFLGNVIPRKGLHTLLAALRQLRPDAQPAGLTLAVAGGLEVDKTYTRQVYRQVEEYGLGRQVCFLGPLDDRELSRLLQDSHVLVVPSSYEGFGIVYLEGMGFGLPAIGGAQGAAREVITHGENGFLIQPGDAAALAGRLRELAADRLRLRAMSLAALQRYKAHPTWEESMASIRRFLIDLCEDSPQRHQGSKNHQGLN